MALNWLIKMPARAVAFGGGDSRFDQKAAGKRQRIWRRTAIAVYGRGAGESPFPTRQGGLVRRAESDKAEKKSTPQVALAFGRFDTLNQKIAIVFPAVTPCPWCR